MDDAMDVDSESPVPLHSALLSKPGLGTKKVQDHKARTELNSMSSVISDSTDWSLIRKTRQFSRQYAHTYFVRLLTMRPCLKEKVSKEWEGIPLKPIAELCESTSTTQNDSSPKKSPQKM